jgi:hypothetical protein
MSCTELQYRQGKTPCMLHFASTTAHAPTAFPPCFGDCGPGFDWLDPTGSLGRAPLGADRVRLMNAPIYTEVLTTLETSDQVELPLATEGVLRYVWSGKFGDILIEVKEGQAFVNGEVVLPADAPNHVA